MAALPARIRDRVQILERPLRARHILAAAAQDEGISRRDAPLATSSRRLAGIRILAAEDNDLSRLALARMLELEAADVTIAENGAQLIEFVGDADSGPWHIILLDIQMPGMDGYETMRRLRAIAPDVPVVALTAHAMPQERRRSLDAGMVEHVTKPVEIERLVNVILRHAHAPSSPASARQSAGAHPDNTRAIDWAAIRERFRNDPVVIDEVVATALKTYARVPERLRAAAGGADLPSIGSIAHGLKGASFFLGAQQVLRLAERAEKNAATEEIGRAHV